MRQGRVVAAAGGSVRVRVPATSANLGPGFDACGLALALYDDLELRVADRGLTVAVTGEGAAELARDETHLVARAARTAFDRLGGQPPGLALACDNRVPHSRGLGSSAAAIVAGMVAARALSADGARLLPDEDLLRLAAELEGHPDNVAACLLGGLTIAWTDLSGARAVRLEPDGRLAPVVFVPTERATTATARALLPASVPHRDAAANAARAALLMVALAGRPELLLAATDDLLHQPYRAASMPASAALLARLREAGVPAVLSGAGPAVLALGGGPTTERAAALAGAGWAVTPMAVDRQGARVRVG